MKARIDRSPQAIGDLDEIWLSIAIDNERAADRLVRRIEDAEDRLAEYPEMGRARNEFANGIRSWPVGDYLLFYRSTPDVVAVLRIVHGARDLGELLSEDP